MSTIGTIELIATIDTSQYKRGAAEIDQTNKNIESSGEQSSKGLSSAFSGVAKVGLAAVAGAAIAVGVAITSNIGAAIKRVDTLNNSSRTFANLGFDAKTVDSSMKALTKSIQGLPTPLDAAVRGVQLIASSTNDLGKSQKIFSAINNAVIGFGGTSEDVTNSVLQLSQAFSGGRIDAQTWNSMLANNLGPTLNALARSMGLTTDQLKTGLSDGSISVGQFQDALIKLNEQGGGGIKSLQQISKDATSGIGTGWQNLNTAIQRGVGAVIEAIGSENISGAISTVGKAFEGALKGIIPVIKFLAQNKDIFGPIAAGITGIVAAITAWWTITKIMTIAQAIFNAVLTANPIGLIIVAIAGLVAALVWFFTQTKIGQQIFQDILNVIKAVFGWISDNWPLLLDILLGPLGVAINAIIDNWNTVQNVISTVFNAIKDIVSGAWDFIVWSFSTTISFFTGIFNGVSDAIAGAFNGIKSAVGSVWDWIKGVFNTIGDIGAGIIKTAVNGVLSFAERTINGFINIINGVIAAVDKLTPGSLGRLGNISVPRLAAGGIVTSPTLAMVGEGRESEAVIPLSKLDNMINGGTKDGGKTIKLTVNLSGVMTDSKAGLREVGKQIIGAVNDELKSNGAELIGGGAI